VFTTAPVSDDTLYENDWVVANRITASIGKYCKEKMGLPDGEPYNLYKRHGTCLRGLQKEEIPHDREDFLKTVHDIDLDIKPDPALRMLLCRLDLRVW
jgi:pyrimidine and pyridine-specific 5'-nucleotidase